MNIAEFRKALSSEATEENIQLKRQLEVLQTEYHEKLSKLENENDSLKKLLVVYAIDALQLREELLAHFAVLITPALICRILRNRWLWLVN